ncbi:hypothetical protein [Aquimarina aquimarini]|uniref:hypothetical protein n=1 Tax=Aquimarina aquimarini TaxID=1191734 RepID=UPI000D54FFC9|nr:hypothetical protein [Aquimarina aquimarini]
MIKGVIENDSSEGIHIINKTANLFTITNKEGVFFLEGTIGDVFVISSVQYDLKVIVVNKNMYDDKEFSFMLKENLNELDEVIVGVQLSGDLNTDIKGIKTEELFSPEDVGIPVYDGIQMEEIIPMHKAIMFYGIGFRLDVEATYKNLSGYYKTLKTTRKLDAENNNLEIIQDFYGKHFLSSVYNLPKEKIYDFLLFCIQTSAIQYEFSKENHNVVLRILSNKRKEFVVNK